MFRIAASAILLSLTTSAALAGDKASIDVPFGDLNLSQTEDARVLAERLETAAKMVCAKANQPDFASGKISQQAMQDCVDAAVTIAIGRIEISLADKLRSNLVSARQIEAAR